MTGWMWDIVLFSWGFLAGVAGTIGGVIVMRMRQEALREGEHFVARLGTVDARRFLDAATE
jgi:hypothetical protein